MSKLETLIVVLQASDAEKEIIDNLILDYYNDQNNDYFITDDKDYKVFTQTEIEDILYEIAESKCDDNIYSLEEFIGGSKFWEIRGALDYINKESYIEKILQSLITLDIEENLEMSFLIEEDGYQIFSN